MNMRKITLAAAGAMATAAVVTGCFFDYPDPTVDAPAIAFNDRAVHDPSVIRAEDGTFYVFGSHLAAARSANLMQWDYVANGLDAANPLWSTIPLDGNQWTGAPGSWAADVIKLADGKYHFYYSFCGVPPGGQCTGPRSYLGSAVSDRIDGGYVDEGIFLRSGMTPAEIAAGYGPPGVTSYDARTMPNTIDPDVFFDKRGRLWMVYGSYSGGIFILEMDPATGRPLPGQGYGKHLAGGDHAQIEGGYMLYSPESGYYYLFTSFGGLAQNDGYNIHIARSRNPNGPFLDAEGRDMIDARGNQTNIAPFGVKLMGGFNFNSAVGDPESERGYLSPGHNSAYYDAKRKQHLLITHTRFPNRGEEHAIRVHEMYVNKDGWLVASPHRTVPIQGRNVVDTTDMLGDYKLIDLGKDINGAAKQSVYVSLNPDFTISGEATGRYRRDVANPNRITLWLDGTPEPFEGVLQFQWNEAANALTPIFTAVSDKGVSLWGSRMATRAPHEVLGDIAAALSLPTAAKDNSLTLPTRGARGAAISWVSSNENVIATDGAVTRPNVGEGDQVVMLTARISLKGQTSERSFQVTVPQRLPFNRVAHYAFENTLADSLGRLAAGTPTGDRLWNAGSIGFDVGQTGSALRLNGTNGVRLPNNLLSNYEYTVSFWINPAVLTRFTTAFFGAVNEQTDPNGFPFSTQDRRPGSPARALRGGEALCGPHAAGHAGRTQGAPTSRRQPGRAHAGGAARHRSRARGRPRRLRAGRWQRDRERQTMDDAAEQPRRADANHRGRRGVRRHLRQPGVARAASRRGHLGAVRGSEVPPRASRGGHARLPSARSGEVCGGGPARPRRLERPESLRMSQVPQSVQDALRPPGGRAIKYWL